MKQTTLALDFTKYVGLNILGMVGLSCYILADTFFIANALGTNGLAALNLAIPLYSVIQAGGQMMGIGGATQYTILRAQDRGQEAKQVFTQALGAVLALGALFLLLGIIGAGPLAQFLGARGETLPMTTTYLRTILCFAPFFLLNNLLLAFTRNDGAPKLAMIAMLAGSFGNIVLDYILIYPLGWGMFGAAFATGLAPILSMAVLSVHFIKKRNGFAPVRCPVSPRQLGSCASLGLSTLVGELSAGLVLAVFNLMILRQAGSVGVAAYGIVANLAIVAISVFNGIAQGAQPLASAAYGAGEISRLRRVHRWAIVLALALAGLIYGAVNSTALPIIALFNGDGNAQLIPIARSGFALYFAGFFFAGPNIVAAAFFSATQRPLPGFWVSITRGCLAIVPLVLVLPIFWGMHGIWLAFVLAEAMACLVALLAARKKSCCPH